MFNHKKAVNFSIIIPTKDRQEILEKSLDSLSSMQNLHDLQIIIVNDSERELILPQKYEFAKVYRNKFGKGVASARNFGASVATHFWMIFMDDDMLVQPDTIQRLIPYCANPYDTFNINWIYPEKLQVKAIHNPFLRYLKHYGFNTMKGWSNNPLWNDEKVFQVDGITSQFLLLSKDAFNKVGGYNTIFPFAGFEDHDMSIRLNKAHIHIYVDPKNMIFHNEEDRMDVQNWLERKKRGAITRRVGVYAGYKELELVYSPGKMTTYKLVYRFRGVLIRILKAWPSTKLFDKAFFLLVNVMLGAYSCVGYTGKEALRLISETKNRD